MADTDPFATGLFGGSPKMAISASATSTVATTVRGNRGERAISSSGQVTKSSSARPRAMQRSRGGSLDIDKMSSKVSNVTYSEMKGRTSRLSLSDRLMATQAWKDEKSAARYQHVVVTEEMTRADLLPAPKRGKSVERG